MRRGTSAHRATAVRPCLPGDGHPLFLIEKRILREAARSPDAAMAAAAASGCAADSRGAIAAFGVRLGILTTPRRVA